MNIHVIAVNPAERAWKEWLGLPAEIPEPSPDDYLTRHHFQEAGRYLVLVHGAKQEARDADLTTFRALPAEIKERLWILFYSGSGIRGTQLSGVGEHLHCLSYPVSKQLGEAATRCFRNALDVLRRPDAVRPDNFWPAFYPPENVAAVTVLALLAATARLDVRPALSTLLRNAKAPDSELSQAYSQYCGVSTLFTGEPVWSYETWQDSLEQERYSELAGELRRVLGRAPD